ncbi:homocitrate synthase [Epichloe bromicola]|uniref:Homocitrate synthase n=1 Tax=Epichloe bromicola TaxID=79588 RepID=A0ABQ0CLK4_9HYPO
MARINMDDDEEVLARIGEPITATEQSFFSFNASDEISLGMSQNANNLELTNIFNKYPAISEALERYRDRLYRLITRIAHFMLAVGNRFQTAIPREWYLLIMTNASAERRRRLVGIMTCPSVQPIALQYLLGQQSSSANMFDRYPHTDLANCDAIGEFCTASTGLARCENGDTFVYSGSATSMCAEKGEISRMMGHGRILALGHHEINRRRERGDKGLLFMDSKMSIY